MSDERALPPEWREVWDALEAPPALDAERTPADPRTRATVEWMRAAWETLDAPAPAPVPSPARRLVPFALALATAAAVLALIRLTRDALEPAPTTPPTAQAPTAQAPTAQAPTAQAPTAQAPPLEAPRLELTPTTLATPIRPHVRADGAVEMRSGKVLLILVENQR